MSAPPRGVPALPPERPDLDAIGGANARQVAEVRLHPLVIGTRGGVAPAFSPLDVPWPVVVSHVRAYVAAALLIRVPVHITLVRATARLRARRGALPSYERTFFTLMLLDSTFYFLVDAMAAHATSAAVEWMVSTSIMHACGLALLHSRGPFRPRATAASVLYRLLILCAFPLMAGRPGARVLWRNAGFACQSAAVAVTVALAPRRDAALRAAHADALEALTRPPREPRRSSDGEEAKAKVE